MAQKVIVFGPTGNVASIVALTAQQQGAKVFLAMRDTQRPIPGLTASQEYSGGFERVQADLIQPESVQSAIQKTGATSAFIYLAWRSTDHMHSTLSAAKEGGIKFVVFLSSFTIRGPLEKIPSFNRIPYLHARVEMNLQDIFGAKNFVALRAGAFATNTLRWAVEITTGQVNLESPDSVSDLITPTDMGNVGGRILAQGQLEEGMPNVVYLYGPKLVAEKDTVATIIRALGKEIEWIDSRGKRHVERSNPPKEGAQRVIARLGRESGSSDWSRSIYSNFQQDVKNVERYTGKPGASFEAWVKENSDKYLDM